MKVLHVITGLGVGGAEQQLRLLLRHLDADCEVVTLTNPGVVAEGLLADGVRVRHLGMAGNRDLSALPRLTALIRAGHYDLVHTHLYRACLYGRIAARMAGVQAVVATEHSLGERQLEGRRLTRSVRALYLAGERLGRATVAVSPTVADRLHRWGVPRQRIHLVPNGIDAAAFRYDPAARCAVRRELGLPEDAFVIGGVGRLAPGKRFDVLVRALAALPEDCRLLLVGGGPEEAALRQAARRERVVSRVVFAGERAMLASPGGPLATDVTATATATPTAAAAAAAGTTADIGGAWGPAATRGAGRAALPALLSAMDVLASPSPEEAFGLAAVEALAAGLPVRYVACPALEDLPRQATTGAERLDCTPEAFALSLSALFTRCAASAAAGAPVAGGGPGGSGTSGGSVGVAFAASTSSAPAAPGPMGPLRSRLEVPEAVRHYSITRSARQLTEVYEQAVLTPPLSPPRPRE
ncbi:glycosyltransferase [Streptomyces sp. NA04227]|uniref:glycosyltransferase n=1 Tax=Streptomyces sp. NA04227 TaxID=2742136 RepID=UPI0015926F50|nr:glycosyltransferase [Streptomyces sp. NA04227]QKW07427.1 glycosyltransferase [Streptomyces sp. NA04227]